MKPDGKGAAPFQRLPGAGEVSPPSGLRGRLLLGGYRGNWHVFFANTGGGDLQPITDHPKDDKPSDWR